MLQIALITYDISPYRGSESSVSWNFVSKISHYVKLIVVYGRHKEDIEKYIFKYPNGNVEWINIPVIPTRHGGTLGHLEYMRNYRHWQKKAKEILHAKFKSGEIDLIHYLNPIGFKEPGYCWQIEGIPYIWGPMQGVENRPLRLLKALSLKGKIAAIGRRISHNALFRFHPRLKKALKNTDIVFAATPNTKKSLKKFHNRDSIYLPENGILKMERSQPISYDRGQKFNMIWVGAVNDRKALVILLDALRQIHHQNWHLTVVGDGDQRIHLQMGYSDLSDRIDWVGKVTRDEAQKLFLSSHLHVISSLGEGNPTVLWEAMSKGIPTMSLNHCGMTATLCDECGIKIPIDTYDNVTSRMAIEIDRLIAEPERITTLSKGVLECSKNFLWDNRISLFIDTYNRLIAQYKNKKTL